MHRDGKCGKLYTPGSKFQRTLYAYNKPKIWRKKFPAVAQTKKVNLRHTFCTKY